MQWLNLQTIFPENRNDSILHLKMHKAVTDAVMRKRSKDALPGAPVLCTASVMKSDRFFIFCVQ